jgi:hypothetical protein
MRENGGFQYPDSFKGPVEALGQGRAPFTVDGIQGLPITGAESQCNHDYSTLTDRRLDWLVGVTNRRRFQPPMCTSVVFATLRTEASPPGARRHLVEP